MDIKFLQPLPKKVGGPRKLVTLIAGGGAVVGGIAFKGGEFAIKKIKRLSSNVEVKTKSCMIELKLYIPSNRMERAITD